MKKQILDEYVTKAKKRDIKKRPRMKLHGQSLKISRTHSGKKLTNR